MKPGRLFLTKVPYDVTKEDLTSDFQQNGQLEAAFVTTGKSTGLKRKAAGETAAPPVHPKKKREGKNTLLTGRVAGTPELTLAVKLSIIQWAEKEGFIKRHDNDNQYTKVAAEYAVDTSWAGDMQHRKINKIRDWANESLRDDWLGFSTNACMQKEHGKAPLSKFCRLPTSWLSLKKTSADDGASVSKVRRRGRAFIKDKYPHQILLLQQSLLELHDEARRIDRGDTPQSCDPEVLYNTWHSLVEKFNRKAKILGQKEVTGQHPRGRFSWTWCRNQQKELGMLTQKKGCPEPKVPDPEDCRKYEKEVRKCMVHNWCLWRGVVTSGLTAPQHTIFGNSFGYHVRKTVSEHYWRTFSFSKIWCIQKCGCSWCLLPSVSTLGPTAPQPTILETIFGNHCRKPLSHCFFLF